MNRQPSWTSRSGPGCVYALFLMLHLKKMRREKRSSANPETCPIIWCPSPLKGHCCCSRQPYMYKYTHCKWKQMADHCWSPSTRGASLGLLEPHFRMGWIYLIFLQSQQLPIRQLAEDFCWGTDTEVFIPLTWTNWRDDHCVLMLL